MHETTTQTVYEMGKKRLKGKYHPVIYPLFASDLALLRISSEKL